MNSTDINCEDGHLKKKAGGTVHDNNPQIVVHMYIRVGWGGGGGEIIVIFE